MCHSFVYRPENNCITEMLDFTITETYVIVLVVIAVLRSATTNSSLDKYGVTYKHSAGVSMRV